MQVSGQLNGTATWPLGKQPPLSIEQEAEWISHPVWIFRRRDKSPTSTGNRLRDPPTHSLVAYRLYQCFTIFSPRGGALK